MFGYVIHRLLVMIPTLLAISAITFLIMQLPPGDFLSTHIAELQSQGESVDMAKIEFLRQQYGLDQPIWIQYLKWMGNLLRGDLGLSLEYQRPNAELIGEVPSDYAVCRTDLEDRLDRALLRMLRKKVGKLLCTTERLPPIGGVALSGVSLLARSARLHFPEFLAVEAVVPVLGRNRVHEEEPACGAQLVRELRAVVLGT